MSFLDLLASIWFQYLIFPFGSVIVGVLIKWATINDRYDNFKKDDLAVGLELALTGALMYIVLTTDRAVELIKRNNDLASMLQNAQIDPAQATQLQIEVSDLSNRIATSGWVIFLMFFGLWSISTFVRKWGWDDSVGELDTVKGIVVPIIFGVLSLVLVMAEAAG